MCRVSSLSPAERPLPATTQGAVRPAAEVRLRGVPSVRSFVGLGSGGGQRRRELRLAVRRAAVEQGADRGLEARADRRALQAGGDEVVAVDRRPDVAPLLDPAARAPGRLPSPAAAARTATSIGLRSSARRTAGRRDRLAGLVRQRVQHVSAARPPPTSGHAVGRRERRAGRAPPRTSRGSPCTTAPSATRSRRASSGASASARATNSGSTANPGSSAAPSPKRASASSAAGCGSRASSRSSAPSRSPLTVSSAPPGHRRRGQLRGPRLDRRSPAAPRSGRAAAAASGRRGRSRRAARAARPRRRSSQRPRDAPSGAPSRTSMAIALTLKSRRAEIRRPAAPRAARRAARPGAG